VSYPPPPPPYDPNQPPPDPRQPQYDPNQPQYAQQPFGPPSPGAPQGQPFGFPPPTSPPGKRNTKLILAVIGGALALCCGGVAVVAVVAIARDDDRTAGVSARASAAAARTPAAPAPAGKTPSGPAAGDAGKFGLPTGTTLRVSGGGDTHEVTVRSMTSTRKSCGSFDSGPKKGYYLVADVTVRVVQGTASVNSLYFTWVGEDGTTSTSISGVLSGCAKSALSAASDLREGQKRAGQIVFDVSSPKGELEYSVGAFGAKTVGSWTSG
jgi:hypothetical protein